MLYFWPPEMWENNILILSHQTCGNMLRQPQESNIPAHYGQGLNMWFSSVQSLSHVRLFAPPWFSARQASLSITNSWILLKLMSIELVMPSSHLILCCPLLLLPPTPPSIRVFSSKPALCMRWPKYWSFSFSISPSNEHPGMNSFRMDWLDLLVFLLCYPTYYSGLSINLMSKALPLCTSAKLTLFWRPSFGLSRKE